MDVDAINVRASVLMKKGIALLSETEPNALTDALACFDEALALRSGLPFDTVPGLRYGLAACWLNRADALVRLGDAAQIALALRAYDEGILLCRGLPLSEDPRYARRFAIAHQNRGLALQAQGALPADAIAAFSDAIAILDCEEAALIPDRQFLLAAVWVNLADARADAATAESGSLAREAALHAIALVAGLEDEGADEAEVGLRARHALCRTIETRWSMEAADEVLREDVHEATDAVDEGLDLARRWEQKGVARFRGVARDLFVFGARVYAKYQPQFLNEFVLDNLDPGRSSPGYVESAEMRAAGEEARELNARRR